MNYLFAGGIDAAEAKASEGQKDGEQPKKRTKVVKRIIKRVKSPAVVPKPDIPTVKSPALPQSTKTVFIEGERHTTRENVVAFFDPATQGHQIPTPLLLCQTRLKKLLRQHLA